MAGDLLIFRAVAEEGSMSAAGDRLNVTQGAISQRIARLEARLKTRLLTRSVRGVELTDAGKTIADATMQAVRLLENAMSDIDAAGERRIVIMGTPSLVTEWLAGRVDMLTEQAGTSVTIHAAQVELTPGELDRRKADLAIVYEPAVPAGLTELAAVAEAHVPVCHPDYRVRIASRSHLCLHDETPWSEAGSHTEWEAWQRATGGHLHASATSHRHFNLNSMAQRVAADGVGVAIGRAVLVGPAIQRGDLVSIGRPVLSPASYRILTFPSLADDPMLRRLASWIAKRLGDSRESCLANITS